MTQQNPQGPAAPRTFADIADMTLSAEDEARLENEKLQAAREGFGSVAEWKAVKAAQAAARGAPQQAEREPLEAAADEPGRKGDLPPWVVLPPSLRFPRHAQVGFIRFPSEWTSAPTKGLTYSGEDDKKAGPYMGKRHRQCIVWPLSVADEKLARAAAKGESLAVYPEMTKRMIRAIDGVEVNWTTGDVQVNDDVGHVPTFWEDIGAVCRTILVSHYHSTHQLSGDHLKHFFAACVVVRTAATTG